MVGALGLTLAVVLVLGRALWRGARAGLAAQASVADIAARANADVYRDQLAELTREREAGRLDDAQWQQAHDELSRRMLEDVGAAAQAVAVSPALAPVSDAQQRRRALVWIAGLTVLVLVSCVVMYGKLGQPMALDPRVVAQGADETSEMTPEKLATMASDLSRRLQDEPNSVEGWVMLARVQRARGLFNEADVALSQALALTQDDDLKIERAEVLAQKNGGNFAGEPWAIIQRVLSADPHQLNALLLAGSASYAEQNYRAALRFWERARDVVSPDAPDVVELERAMAQARDKLGLPPVPPRSAQGVAASPAIGKSSISGRVSLGRELAGKVAPTDAVLIYAVPVAGSRMPVAMIRTTVDKLPLDFVLDDSTTMRPDIKLSTQTEVTVRVRISKQAQAAAQAGDLGLSVSPVKPGTQGLDLVVRDTVR